MASNRKLLTSPSTIVILVGKMLDSSSILVGLLDAYWRHQERLSKKLTQLFADWWNCRESFSRKLSWFKDQRFDQFPPSPQPLALRLNLGSFEFSSGENLFIASCLWVNKHLIYTDISSVYSRLHMGVSKNRGTPKWMVYNGKPYFLMDDLGGTTIFGNIHIDIIHLPQEAVEAPLKSFSNHLKPALARRVRGSLGTWESGCVIQFEFRHLKL